MSLEKVERCPVCSGQSFQPYLECKDHTTSGEVFHVEQCPACGLLLTNPRPTESSAPSYYQSSQYISHQSESSGLFDYIYLTLRRLALRWKYRLVKPYLLHRTILDFGCGTGAFLHYCRQQGNNVFGVEPSNEARAIAKNQNLPLSDTIKKLPDQKFDVITLWHVLEHVYDLTGTLQALKARLNDHGIIFIAVPNHESYDAVSYRSLWAAYDVPRHIWHFKRESMTRLLDNNGLRVKEIFPMKLDAYYVSMLSEKYKAGNRLGLQHAVPGIFTGWKSNRRARLDKNYSSLIYIAEK